MTQSQIILFPKMSKPALGPKLLPVQQVMGSYPKGEVAGFWSYISIHQYPLSAFSETASHLDLILSHNYLLTGQQNKKNQH